MSRVKAFVVSAYLWLALLYMGGAVCVVAGCYLIAGSGAGLVVSGAFLLVAFRFLLKGISNG